MPTPQSSIHRNNKAGVALTARYVLPTYGRQPVVLVHGRGTKVWDADGKEYLDFFAGLAVDNLGHAPEAVRKALADQLGRLWHCSNVFHIQEQAELAQKLVALSGLDKAFFCNSGTEANEAAIKLARYHSLKHGHPGRYEIIVCKNSFHGRTLGSLSATQQPKYQQGFGPLVEGFIGVPFGDLAAVERAVSESTCAVMVEPIQGEGGVNVAPSGYLKALRKLCDAKNLSLIVDEVQTGIGRTGQVFACRHEKMKPDFLVLAKGLGSGFPLGACVVSEKIARDVVPGLHAATFGGNPLACRAALATLQIVSKPAFLKKVSVLGKYLQRALTILAGDLKLKAKVRGLGLMVALELAEEVGPQVVAACLKKGLIINAVQGRILRFVPPLIITHREIDRAVKILHAALEEVLGGSS